MLECSLRLAENVERMSARAWKEQNMEEKEDLLRLIGAPALSDTFRMQLD